jgi:hypothetical protein
MGLAEGTIRKNGLPAKKPGGPQLGAGRPSRTTCALPECGDPLPEQRHKTGPKRHFCSDEHNAVAYRRYHLHKQYDMTNDEFDQMLAAQGGRCAICRTDEPRSGGRGGANGTWHVDHDHATGKNRGLLCSNCNRMLGQAKDNPATLRAGADYLERTR